MGIITVIHSSSPASIHSSTTQRLTRSRIPCPSSPLPWPTGTLPLAVSICLLQRQASKRSPLTDGTDSLVKHVLQSFLCQGGAFQELCRSNLLVHAHSLLITHGCHASKHGPVIRRRPLVKTRDAHLSRSFSIDAGSSRKSSLVPTRSRGTPGA